MAIRNKEATQQLRGHSNDLGYSPNTKSRLTKLASELQVEIDDIQHPPFEIVDNTDDLEPSPAHIKKI
jgi:hypothetical protein